MRWSRPSLARLGLAPALLAVLLPALALLSLAQVRVSSQDVQRAADTAYDRSLLGALRSIDASVSTESGGLSVELPYHLFELFELTASGPVYWRVASRDGLVELGSADLPRPPAPLAAKAPQFYDGTYFGQPVRLVAYARDTLVIQVAESRQAREDFIRVFSRRVQVTNLVFLLLAIACAVAAVALVLRPLRRLSAQLARRGGSGLEPLPLEGVPADVRPLVAGMNLHMQRAADLAAQQRAFLDDASHQLRTHLTTMRMQVDFALREKDAQRVQDALAALAEELQRAGRATNQLLALARSEAVALEPAPFALRGLLEDVARQFLPAARDRGLDLGVEGEDAEATGDAALLREAVANLVANAIAYVPGGSVTLRAGHEAGGWRIAVEDTGPGLPADLRSAAGTRFLRSANRTGSGSGLGLAIARAVAARHGGVLRLEPGADGAGLIASICWPRPATGSEGP